MTVDSYQMEIKSKSLDEVMMMPFAYIKFRNKIFSKISNFVILVRLVLPRKIPFENMGTSFSSLEILQGAEVR